MADAERGAGHPTVKHHAVGVYSKGLLPCPDNGIIQGTLQAPQSSSFTNMAQRQRRVSDVILKDPAVESLTSFVGVDGTNPSLNSARLQINLKPLDKRDDRVQKVIARLQDAVASVPGVNLYLQPTQDLTIDTRESDAVSVHATGHLAGCPQHTGAAVDGKIAGVAAAF